MINVDTERNKLIIAMIVLALDDTDTEEIIF